MNRLSFIEAEKCVATRIAEYERDEKITLAEVEYLINLPDTFHTYGYFKTCLDRSMLITARNKLLIPKLLSDLITEITYSPEGGSVVSEAADDFRRLSAQL
jgi:hypothetical protein